MAWIYVPVLIIGIYYALRYYFRRTFNYWKDRNVPGPEPLTFYGNMKDQILRKKNVGIIYPEIYKQFPNEKVVGIYRTTNPCLVIRDLDVIKHILIKDFDKFMDRGLEFSKEGLGVNLFHADGDTWRALRGRLSPVFTSGKLKNMFYLINECAEKFMDTVEKKVSISTEQECHDLVKTYTISSICACAFGVDMHSINASIFDEIDKMIFTPNISGDLDMMYPGILKKISLSLFPRKLTSFFNNMVKTVVTQRNGKPTNRNDFMDLLLEMKQLGSVQATKFGDNNTNIEITQDLMAAQAFVFYAAGYETSATTMTYMLHELAKNMHVQEKLIKEIDETLQNHDNKITYESIKDMKYLEKVFNETLRMHSIVDPLHRQAREDYKIPGTDVVIEKGQMVYITPRGIHHDEKYYPNPEVFDPERFSPEVAGNRHPCAYLPFGTGPRNCIGLRFGQLQSRICITHLLSKYRVELSSNSRKNLSVDPYRIIAGPKDGVRINVIPRN